MTQVGIAIGAHDLDPCHAVTGIGFSIDVSSDPRSCEAGPTAPGVEFVVRVKQRRAATDAGVNAGILAIVVFAGEGSFRTLATGDLILFWR